MTLKQIDLSLQLEPELLERLEAAAGRSSMPVAAFVEQAVSAAVERDEWEVAEIGRALREADEGKFASEEEVAAMFAKYRVALTPSK